MALSPRIELRQKHALVMTPQLQQSIKLLQLNNAELAEYVAGEVERNPLLEVAPPAPGSGAGGRGTPSGSGEGSILDTLAAEVTLWEHLRDQIGAARASDTLAEIALILIDELDDEGYLRVPLDELAARHRLTAREVRAGLALLQSCDPPGIGARSLRECLMLQLRDRDRLDPAMQAFLANLPLLAAGRIADLQTACGVDDEDLADMIAEVRALDPRPGRRFANDPVQVVVPDVFVVPRRDGVLGVELNTETLPRVLVNNAYASTIDTQDTEARSFVSECAARAGWLVRSLEQRARTMLQVSSAIVAHQEPFFTRGPEHLRPLTQRAIAEQVGLHESTISRVVAGKHLACGGGVHELRYFFSASIQAISRDEAFSAVAVQDRIRRLIGAENGRATLSDDHIVRLLREDGIDIARRTVAKYREGMGIPSSVARRRLKAGRADP